MMRDFGTDEQRAEWMPGFLDGTRRLAFGLTEPNHGSDATYLETTARPDGDAASVVVDHPDVSHGVTRIELQATEDQQVSVQRAIRACDRVAGPTEGHLCTG